MVELADRGITVFVTSHDLPGIEAIASRLAMLRDGRLELDEELETLKGRFRKITFGRTEGVGERRADGTDLLADLEPITVRRQGRRTEALVSRFTHERFAELSSQGDVERAEVQPVSLEEILVALSDPTVASGDLLTGVGDGRESEP